MASLNELITLLRDVVEQIRESAVKAAAARDRVEAESEKMRGVLDGHNSELPAEALGKWSEARERIDEALASFGKGNDTMEGYIALLLGGGPHSSTAVPPARSQPPPPPEYPRDRTHRIGYSALVHVAHGDDLKRRSGGHLAGTGRPGKTEFPAHWGLEDIKNGLEAVAGAPDRTDLRSNGNWYAYGRHRGVEMVAVVRPDGSIEAGWPKRGPGVKENPR